MEMEREAARHRPSCGGFAWCDVSLPLEKRPLVKHLRRLVAMHMSGLAWVGVGVLTFLFVCRLAMTCM